MTLPAFWDGGNIWRVRFSPPFPGIWTYTSSSSPADAGLNNVRGQVVATVTPTTSNVTAYKRGFLRVAPNNRYFTYFDGTPFFWLGDTHWSGVINAERIDASDDPRFKSMFYGLVDVRSSQGYTIWKAETFANNHESGNSPINEGGPAWINESFFELLNPKFWQACDVRLNYVVEHDMYISLAQGIGRSMKSPDLLSQHKRLAKYLLARYGALPVVWITCQEYCANACSECWAEVAEYVYELDPYARLLGRPNSMHNCATNPIAYHNQSWYGFVTLQLGHNRVDSVDHWYQQYQAQPARPILEDEANYEQLIPAYGGGALWKTRQSAWQAIIGGAFGYTYGGQGVWYGCYSLNMSNHNCGQPPDSRAWYQTISFEFGSKEIFFLKQFFQSLVWWDLEPDPQAIAWRSPAPTNSQRPFQKANSNRTVVVAYLPQVQSSSAGSKEQTTAQLQDPEQQTTAAAAYQGVLQSLNPSLRYMARWFSPRSGEFTTISSNITGATSWQTPLQPNASVDWVLLFEGM
eukprot:m.78842 g.78842  ORF g.78842 m.78842 type:complete len:519 (+) comp20802_c0_seq1:216-1772(+)